jgi:hypothetical protein
VPGWHHIEFHRNTDFCCENISTTNGNVYDKTLLSKQLAVLLTCVRNTNMILPGQEKKLPILSPCGLGATDYTPPWRDAALCLTAMISSEEAR